MSGDLQAKRKSKNRSKKKSQLHDLERKEHFGEALQAFGDEEEDTPPSGGINKVRFVKVYFQRLIEFSPIRSNKTPQNNIT